jgi:hypothetical protein
MSLSTMEVSRIAVQTAGVTTPTSINASTTITLPTTSQRPTGAGIIEAVINVEGTVPARWTINGTVPTAAIGMLLQPNTYLTLHGESSISNFRIIGTAAGDTMTVQFFKADER